MTTGPPARDERAGEDTRPAPTPKTELINSRYKVLKQLGRGGMGAVYLAEHPVIGKRVAVKVLPASFAADPAMVERFLAAFAARDSTVEFR